MAAHEDTLPPTGREFVPDSFAGELALELREPGWAGADLYESTDGAFYALIDEGLQEMAGGITRSAMPDALLPFQTDRNSQLSVLMVTGSLAAVTELEMLNGANRALLVKSDGSAEVIAFAQVAAGSNGACLLSTFLWGLRGIEGETSGHAAGEQFVLLDDGALDRRAIALDWLGTERAFRAVGRGQALSDVPTRRITPIGRDLMPYAPAQLAASGAWGLTITISWGRQTVATPQLSYTTVMQGEDFVGAQAELTFRVYQMSAHLPDLSTAGALVAEIVLARPVDFPAAFTGSTGYARIAAMDETVLDVQKNGANVGTVTFAAASGSPAARKPVPSTTRNKFRDNSQLSGGERMLSYALTSR